jgi:hypothetical protein
MNLEGGSLMTAVAELDRDDEPSRSPSSPPTPSEEQLLDVLYEVLAQGVPPRSSLTREELERFLHEHAREAKPISEMLQFFELHSLPVDANEYGADRELGELASGLQKERSSLVPNYLGAELPQMAVPLPAVSATITAGHPRVESSSTLLSAASIPSEASRTGRRPAIVLAPPPSHRVRWLAAAVLVAGLGLTAALVVSHERASQLETRLEQARAEQRGTDEALKKIEERAASLQGALKQSEEERRAAASRLETELAEEAKKRETEQLTLERLLGPRYKNVRQKLATEAVTAAP